MNKNKLNKHHKQQIGNLPESLIEELGNTPFGYILRGYEVRAIRIRHDEESSIECMSREPDWYQVNKLVDFDDSKLVEDNIKSAENAILLIVSLT